MEAWRCDGCRAGRQCEIQAVVNSCWWCRRRRANGDGECAGGSITISIDQRETNCLIEGGTGRPWWRVGIQTIIHIDDQFTACNGGNGHRVGGGVEHTPVRSRGRNASA